ncbi:hypothetical protein CLOP_g2098, partial [Closterium sp. NIES-67]
MCRLLGKARLWRWRGMDMREAASRWEQQVGRGVQAQAWRPRGPWAAHEARTSGVPNQSEPPGCDLAAMCVAHSLPRAGGCGAAWLAGAHRAGRLPRVPQMRHHLPARLESLSAARLEADATLAAAKREGRVDVAVGYAARSEVQLTYVDVERSLKAGRQHLLAPGKRQDVPVHHASSNCAVPWRSDLLASLLRCWPTTALARAATTWGEATARQRCIPNARIRTWASSGR